LLIDGGHCGHRYLARHCAGRIVPLRPQATYLVWLDCRGMGLSDEALSDFMLREANLMLTGGGEFAEGTGQWQRINVACARATVEEAAARLRAAVERRFGKSASSAATTGR
jgi:cystathionine beta-lyase